MVKHFIEKYNKKENRQIKGISPEVEKEFYNYNWPGNVRELENVIERAVTLTNEDIISLNVILPLVKKEGERNLSATIYFLNHIKRRAERRSMHSI